MVVVFCRTCNNIDTICNFDVNNDSSLLFHLVILWLYYKPSLLFGSVTLGRPGAILNMFRNKTFKKKKIHVRPSKTQNVFTCSYLSSPFTLIIQSFNVAPVSPSSGLIMKQSKSSMSLALCTMNTMKVQWQVYLVIQASLVMEPTMAIEKMTLKWKVFLFNDIKRFDSIILCDHLTT